MHASSIKKAPVAVYADELLLSKDKLKPTEPKA